MTVPSALGLRVLLRPARLWLYRLRSARASFAPCASVTAPSAPGPRTLCRRPRPRLSRTGLPRPCPFTLVPPSAPALSCTGLPRPCPRATVASVRVPHRFTAPGPCATVASVCAALGLPPSGPRVPRPARLWLYRLRPARTPLVPPPCPRATVASVFTAPAPFAAAPGPRALRVCDCAVCVRPAHPRAAARACVILHRLAAARPARYGGLRLCCAQLPPSASRPCAPARL